MLRPRWRKVLRDAGLHKGRTLLAVATLFVGLVAAGALLDTWALVRRATAETYLASHPVSATLRLDSVDGGALAAVRALPAIASARARRTAIATIESGGGQLTAELFALGDFGARDIAVVEPAGGQWPPRDGEIAIEKSALEFSRAAVGDEVALRVAAGAPRSLRVTGVAHDVSLPPGWMDHVVYGFVTLDTLRSLGLPATLNEMQITVRDGGATRQDVRGIADGVRSVLEARGLHVIDVDVPVPGEHAHAAQMDSMMLTQGAFAALTLVVCALLIVNVMAALLSGQSREIAVMKALGARWQQVAAMYVVFAAGVGAAGSAVALPVAIALGRWYAGLRGEMLNFPTEPFSIPLWVIALQLAVGSLLPVAASALVVVRACRIPVVAALGDPGVATAAGYSVRRRITLPFVPRALTLSIGNAFRKRGRMALTLAALAAGGSVYIAAHNLRAAMHEAVDLAFASQHYDFLVRVAGARPAPALESAALSAAQVERAEAWIALRAKAASPGGAAGHPFALLGVPPHSAVFAPPVAEGRWLSGSNDREVVVSRTLAKELGGLVPGASLALVIDGESSTWTVAGLADIAGQQIAYVPRNALVQTRGRDDASLIAVGFRHDGTESGLAQVLALREELAAAGMEVASSTSLAEARRVIEDHLAMVVDFLAAMGWVMIAVGGMGLASAMGLAVLERTREIGVMRAIGASHPAILGMIEAEGLAIALLGWLLSLPLSVPMSAALAYAFGKVMFTVPVRYVPSVAGAASWLAIVVAVAIVAAAGPALRAMRITAARALAAT